MTFSVFLCLIIWVWEEIALLTRGPRKLVVYFVGMDNAGKTTLIHLLEKNQLAVVPPTLRSSLTVIPYNRKFQIEAVDLGTRTYDRDVRYNCQFVDHVFLMIDASDPERFDEARTKIPYWLGNVNEKTSIALFGNKVDRPGCPSEAELEQILGLRQDGLRIKLFLGSVVLRKGYFEALDWLLEYTGR